MYNQLKRCQKTAIKFGVEVHSLYRIYCIIKCDCLYKVTSKENFSLH